MIMLSCTCTVRGLLLGQILRCISRSASTCNMEGVEEPWRTNPSDYSHTFSAHAITVQPIVIIKPFFRESILYSGMWIPTWLSWKVLHSWNPIRNVRIQTIFCTEWHCSWRSVRCHNRTDMRSVRRRAVCDGRYGVTVLSYATVGSFQVRDLSKDDVAVGT